MAIPFYGPISVRDVTSFNEDDDHHSIDGRWWHWLLISAADDYCDTIYEAFREMDNLSFAIVTCPHGSGSSLENKMSVMFDIYKYSSGSNVLLGQTSM